MALTASFSRADGGNYDVHIQALNWDFRMRLNTMNAVSWSSMTAILVIVRMTETLLWETNVAVLGARMRRSRRKEVFLSFFPSLFIEGIYQNDKTRDEKSMRMSIWIGEGNCRGKMSFVSYFYISSYQLRVICWCWRTPTDSYSNVCQSWMNEKQIY